MDSGGVQRRVSSCRKRRLDKGYQTPKKARYKSEGVAQEQIDVKTQEEDHRKSSVIGQSGSDAQPWIENSFLNSANCQKRILDKKQCAGGGGVGNLTSKDSNDPTAVDLCQVNTDGSVERWQTAKTPLNLDRTDDVSVFADDGASAETTEPCSAGIFHGAKGTSTPRRRTRKSTTVPKTPEPYASQHHQSFDDTDPLFAEMDMQCLVGLPPGADLQHARVTNDVQTGTLPDRHVQNQVDFPGRPAVMPGYQCRACTEPSLNSHGYSNSGGDLCGKCKLKTLDKDADSDASIFKPKCDESLPQCNTIIDDLPNLTCGEYSGNKSDRAPAVKNCNEQSGLGSTRKTPSKQSVTMETSGFGSDDSLFEDFVSELVSQGTPKKSPPKRSRSDLAIMGNLLSNAQNEHIEDLRSPNDWPQVEAANIPTKNSSGEPAKASSVASPVATGRRNRVVSGSKKHSESAPVATRSFRDRMKATLQQNAKANTPRGGRKLHQLREQSVIQAVREAAEIQAQGSEFDIGPFYGLPSQVKELLEKHRGIKELYDWQNECLTLKAVREDRNLIYSLPTSGGKTLVAEILILREILCKKKDAILILPYVSIVQEKVRGLSPFAVDLDFLVEEYAGSKGGFPPKPRRKRKSLFVCTIEKANSLVNSLIENGRLDSVGLVVVDELHMLGEGASRGATLEMTLAKVMHSAKRTQVVGMSATLSNLGDLQQFLSAEVYSSDFRPVELREFVKLDDTIYEIDGNALCPEDRLKHDRVVTFKYDKSKQKCDPDHLAGLVLEVIPDHSCLVFCPTKKNCENVAELLCRMMDRKMRDAKKEERRALLRALLHDGNGEVCPVLCRTVPYGVAYHHSGLTMDERKLVEEAYAEGTLCLLACTSTLAAGVNLPAKRVILRSPYVGASFLSRSQYKQMVGRAGRAGLDSSGESIVILQRKDKTKLSELVSGPCDYCWSSLLYENHKGVRGLLLTTVGLKITPSVQSVNDFLKKTLCYVQRDHLQIDVSTTASEALQYLCDLDLITQVSARSEEGQTDQLLEVTNLGQAVFKGSIDITRGPQLYRDLCQAQESLVVANYLHLLYLVTPYDLVEKVRPHWMTYFDQLSVLGPCEIKVANIIGVSESYISKKTAGQKVRKVVDEFVVNRFYLTLILYNLWKQKSIWDVAAKFQQPRGFIQQLLNGAASFAACISHFCKELQEFWAYQDLLASFVVRLSYCVTTELIPLMEIPGVKIGRARQLYSVGLKSLQTVAYADPSTLARNVEHMPKKIAQQIVAAAQMLLQEKAESLREEADDLVTMPAEAVDAAQAVQMAEPTVEVDGVNI